MKRFLVSFIIGMTLLAAGVTTLIFELRDFRFVDASSEEIEQNSLSDEITIGKEDVNCILTMVCLMIFILMIR